MSGQRFGKKPLLVLTPEEAVAGNPAALRELARNLRVLIGQIEDRSLTLRKELAATDTLWKGTNGNTYRFKTEERLKPYTKVHKDIIPMIAGACDTLASALETAQRTMKIAMDAARAIPLSPIPPSEFPDPYEVGLIARVCWQGAPAEGRGQMSSVKDKDDHSYWIHYGYTPSIAEYLRKIKAGPEVFTPMVEGACAAFKLAREARLAFVQGVGGAREEMAPLMYGIPTAAELEEDRLVGSGEKGNWRTGAHSAVYKTDAQGRVIYYRYGEGDGYDSGGAYFKDDATWAPYLQRSGALRNQVKHALEKAISDAQTDSLMATGTVKERVPLDLRRNVEIENGYGTGYQLLHGTEATVGDFHIKGEAVRQPDGSYKVTATYTWNDIIDPNHTYGSDTVFNKVTGGGKPYNMHISWEKQTTMTPGRNGSPTTFSGDGGAWP